MSNKWVVTVVVAVIAVAALAAAVVLEITGHDANNAWVGFGGAMTFFGGLHIPSPSQTGS